ncbi:N-6 DNA methylase [Methanococcus maripaludis]|uniref:site-specific DNA-methyltransferase (adenine-specific) n=1 Tax=Methanococcus maripaludis TaxID=39152 RepID=A0A7J9PVK2_METMI|nr:N-6 DNA methylase [Methanococcus maripaludis]MBA2869448.1 type I restriction enzyme M protein [Methanococcus maripaludis]
MLDKDTKTRINNARDVLVGKVPDPKSQVEQITIALIYKFMDDIDNDLIEWGSSKTYFTGEYEKYKWSNLLSNSLSGENRLKLYSEALEQMSKNENIPQLFRDIFKNAFLPYKDPETLKLFLKEIDWFDYHNSEKLGDAFEYLLSIMSSQGDAGQFRTPRHIIDFIVDIVRPQKHERILDPACGTAGFLISAFKYIMDSNKNAGTDLTPEEREALVSNFSGYDISPDMVRLSLVNLYLHGFQDPHIYEYDTLTSEERWGDKFDVILANPPFMTPKGGIRPHNKFVIKAKRSEVLFVDYMVEHLMPNGRAGIIVPEGIIFQSGTAYKSLRKELIEGKNLWAVVSLPAGVFNPYSGVKTSILLLDKEIAKKTDKILFVDIKNDGFDLGAQRRRINGCDLPDALSELIKYHDSLISGEEYLPESEMFNTVEIAKISENGDYNLTGNRYKEIKLLSSNYKMVELDEVVDIVRGGSPRPINDYLTDSDDGINWIKIGDTKNTSKYIYETKEKIKPEGISKSRMVKEGDFILSNSMSFGRPYIMKTTGCIHDGWLLLRIKTQDLDQDYLYNILSSEAIYNTFKNSATGSSVNNLNIGLVKKVKIPLPPLEIQKQIVKEIESYQNIVESAKNIVESYKPNFKINPDWELVELGEVAEIVGGGTPSKNNKEYWTDGTIKWISARHIDEDNKINFYELITEKALNESSAKVAPINSTIFITRVSVGKITFADDNYAINQDLTFLNPKTPNLYNKYLFMILRHYSKIIADSAQGLGVKGITKSYLSSFKIPLPPLEEQQKIVERIEEEQNIVNANKRLIEIYEHKIKEKIGEIWGE